MKLMELSYSSKLMEPQFRPLMGQAMRIHVVRATKGRCIKCKAAWKEQKTEKQRWNYENVKPVGHVYTELEVWGKRRYSERRASLGTSKQLSRGVWLINRIWGRPKGENSEAFTVWDTVAGQVQLSQYRWLLTPLKFYLNFSDVH
jgi:hypothetical protein